MSQPDAAWRSQADALLCAILRKTPLELEQALSGTSEPAVSIARWAERLRSGRVPVVLPCARGGNAPPEYYGIVFTGRQLREFREQLLAFVGPTWTDFTGQAISPDPLDPIEGAIRAVTDQPVFRIRLASVDARKPVRMAIDRLLDVVTAVAARDPEDMRATGRVLRQFYYALAAADRATAETELEYLRLKRRLDALNLEFLEVQLRAQCGAWEEILALPTYGDLVQSRRPVAVSRALLQALYYRYLAPHEIADDLEAMASAFREAVLPRAGTLFDTRAGMTEPEVLKQFMLLAVVGTPPRPELRTELIDLVVPAAEDHTAAPLTSNDQQIILRLGLKGLDQKQPETPSTETTTPAASTTPDPLEAARIALETYDYDLAFRLAREAVAGPDRARVLLVCAYEIDTLETREVARAAFDELDSQERERLLTSRLLRAAWSQVLAKAAVETTTETSSHEALPKQPQGWDEWLNLLTASGTTAITLERWAEQGADEWEVTALAQAPKTIEHLAGGLYDHAGDERLHDALPHLIRYLQRDPNYPQKPLFGVYRRVQFALVAAATGSKSEVANFSELCQAVFHLGVPSKEYSQLMLEVVDLWKVAGAAANLEPWLDVLDQLVYFPCPPEAQAPRRKWVTTMLTECATWARAHRVNSSDWRILQQLAGEIHLQDLLADVVLVREENEEHSSGILPEQLRRFSGTIALYTLTESAGQRARQILRRWNSRCRVELSSEKVGTPQLRDLARNADLFVVVTGSAKHAATGFVQAHRGERPILFPSGKGTSSILRVIERHFASNQAQATI